MKKYWFIIETYVFLWKKESSVLVYNTLSGHGYTYNCTPLMSSFIDKLISPENLYCLKSASNLNGNLNCSKELEHYAS